MTEAEMQQEQAEPLDQALAEHDLTRALTSGRLLLAVATVFVALRLVRGLRDGWAMRSVHRRHP